MLVRQLTISELVGQIGSIVVLNPMIGNFADQMVGHLARFFLEYY